LMYEAPPKADWDKPLSINTTVKKFNF